MIVEKKLVIKNKSGLHARPAAIFVQIANKYDCEITIKKGKQEVNGKSIMGIMMLAAEKGSKITIIAEGDDARQAVQELERILLSETVEEFDEKK
ncbi:MAG: HPr family phosphocarrier protein [Candidatus Omnitrophota bacterium]|nr:MAG: HPr family phosphocarrier protein [Candidatus Omnitrophota bacterium]